MATFEQCLADEAFQGLNPSAERRGRQRQFLRCRLDRSGARDMNERLDRGKGGQAAHDGRLCNAPRAAVKGRSSVTAVIVANASTVRLFFALAQNNAALHIEQAFQASSPKTFPADPERGRPFFVSRGDVQPSQRARRHPISRTDRRTPAPDPRTRRPATWPTTKPAAPAPANSRSPMPVPKTAGAGSPICRVR